VIPSAGRRWKGRISHYSYKLRGFTITHSLTRIPELKMRPELAYILPIGSVGFTYRQSWSAEEFHE
jgi:hypothetical protein